MNTGNQKTGTEKQKMLNKQQPYSEVTVTVYNKTTQSLQPESHSIAVGRDATSASRMFNPLSPKRSPFDEENRLALDRVKCTSHSQGVKG